ncbi:MAG: hypothetical protein WDN06_02560 [Asticcacaulis sp.]
MGGPDEVAAALLGQHGSAVMNFAQGLDGLFVKFADIARALDSGNTTQNAGIGVINSHSMPVTLFWLSGLFLLVSTLGVLILTRLTLYLLLILGRSSSSSPCSRRRAACSTAGSGHRWSLPWRPS